MNKTAEYYDERVAESIAAVLPKVPFMHTVIFNALRQSGVPLTDTRVTSDQDASDNLFKFVFEVRDVNGRPHNFVSLYAEKEGVDKDYDTTAKDLAYSPRADEDPVGLTAAWHRYLHGFQQEVTRLEDVIKNTEGGHQEKHTALMQNLVSPDMQIDAFAVVNEIAKIDSTLVVALHRLFHEEGGTDRLHAIMGSYESTIMESDYDMLYWNRQVNKSFTESKTSSSVAGLLSLLEMLGRIREQNEDNLNEGD